MSEFMKEVSPEEIHIHVRNRYGGIAEKQQAGCGCGDAQGSASSCCGGEDDPAALDQVSRLYEAEDVGTRSR